MPDESTKEYIGDGVYISVDHGELVLETDRGSAARGSNPMPSEWAKAF